MTTTSKTAMHDSQVQEVCEVLAEYKDTHPHAQIECRRQNAVAIHIRIIDPDFLGMDRVEREPEVWKLLEKLPKETIANIAVLLLLTPDETKDSFASYDFDHPAS